MFAYLETINTITQQSVQGLESISLTAHALNHLTEQLESMARMFILAERRPTTTLQPVQKKAIEQLQGHYRHSVIRL